VADFIANNAVITDRVTVNKIENLDIFLSAKDGALELSVHPHWDVFGAIRRKIENRIVDLIAGNAVAVKAGLICYHSADGNIAISLRGLNLTGAICSAGSITMGANFV
jgi:hypothetical protein